jgi:Cof subfamily protein (haloacid dehalogenase superfamily)
MDRRWIIYLDVDGTLLDSRLTVSRRVRSTLRTVEQQAVIVLASGRPAASCVRLARELLDQPRFVIASNGGVVVDCATSELVYASGFAPGVAADIAGLAQDWPVALCLYHPTEWYTAAGPAGVSLETKRSGTQPTYVRALDDYLVRTVKLLLIGQPTVIRWLKPLVAQVPGVAAFVSYPEYLEIMPSAVSKATAVRVVQGRLWRDSAVLTMAIGDGDGDIPLLRAVDYAVAVANASERVRSVAHYIAPSNDDDGVAVALDALVRGRPQALELLVSGRREHLRRSRRPSSCKTW